MQDLKMQDLKMQDLKMQDLKMQDLKMQDLKMQDLNKNRDQVLNELRSAYESGASIRSLVAETGRSYGSVHSMLRESGTTMRSRGGPNHRNNNRS